MELDHQREDEKEVVQYYELGYSFTEEYFTVVRLYFLRVRPGTTTTTTITTIATNDINPSVTTRTGWSGVERSGVGMEMEMEWGGVYTRVSVVVGEERRERRGEERGGSRKGKE